MDWVIQHWKDITEIISYIIAIASIIVRLTPTLDDDNVFLPVIKFIAKYIALNRSGDDRIRSEREKLECEQKH